MHSASETALHNTTPVHDTQIDPTGRFLVTCSSDHSLTLFESIDDLEGVGWEERCSVRDPSAPIHRAAWAHPSFGTVVATVSADRTIHVYRVKPDTSQKSTVALCPIHQIRDNERDTMTDLCFLPRQHGLSVVTAWSDGALRVYDCTSEKQVARVIPNDALPSPLLCVSCLGTIAESTATFASGAMDGSVVVGRLDKGTKQWNRAVLYSSVADATNGRNSLILKENSPVAFIAFAPCCGQADYTLAWATSSNVKIAKLGPQRNGFQFLCQIFEIKTSCVRLTWNANGTNLAVIEDDLKVKIFQEADFDDRYMWELRS